MLLRRGDPRQDLSRRTQDFHDSDPATQAALTGEPYFDVTPGHFVSGALESGYFDTVEECLDFFGLERSVLGRSEPFEYWEIANLESAIQAEAEGRLEEGIDLRYQAWADWLVDTYTLAEEDRPEVFEGLIGVGPVALTDEEVGRAEELEILQDRRGGYHEGLLRMQRYRLLGLLARDGFAITARVAAESFSASGLLPEHEYDEGFEEIATNEVASRLAVAAYHGLRREVEDGVIDPKDFAEADWDYRFDQLDGSDFASWSRDVLLGIVLSARDLHMFASYYAAPAEVRGLSEDPKYQTLMRLIKNTPERIKEVSDHIQFLASKPVDTV